MMKKNILVIIVCIILSASLVSAQVNTTIDPPYKRFPTFPPVKLLLTDSTTYFTKADLKKKSAVLLMLFNPDCDHCQKETEDILKNIDKFKKIRIVLATTMSFEMMKSFYTKYNLALYDNIVVGQDFQFFLPSFFIIRNLPFLAFYDKKNELISVFEGAPGVSKILAAFEK